VLSYVLERILGAKARLNLSNVFVGGGGVRGCGEKGVAILLKSGIHGTKMKQNILL
jgi:hypothetical protein